MLTDLIAATVGFLLFLGVGTMFLFFPHRLLHWAALLARFNYVLLYGAFDKIPERNREKISRGLDAPEEAEFTLCAYRAVGVLILFAAALTLVLLVIPMFRNL